MSATGFSPTNPHLDAPLPGPRGHWLWGSLPDIQSDPLAFLLRISREYGELVPYRLMFFRGFLLNQPDFIKHVLQENNRNYNKDAFDYRALRPLVGNGLLTSDGAFWLRQRRLIQPAFHRQHIQDFSRLMVTCAQETLARWESPAFRNQPFDVLPELMRLTLRVVGLALFSQEISGAADAVGANFTFLNEAISTRLRALFPPPLSLPTPANRRFLQARRALDEVVNGIIARRRAALEQSQGETGDLLSTLLQARDEETGQGMDDRQVRDEVMTLLLAGHETTANALAWTLYLLSQHPTEREQLYQEVADVLQGRPPAFDDLPRLPYTRRVLQESLRLYPPAWILSRKATGPDQLGSHPVRPGTVLLICSYSMHRHPAYWEDPDCFDPQRFTPERSAGRPSFAYFPFGGGPRLCIGRDFAMTEALLVLALIAQRCRLDLVPGHPVEPEPLITLRPRYGLKMAIQSL